jgi:8-oxo-dGTP pyrophosphatase MutT (NUDIX family)
MAAPRCNSPDAAAARLASETAGDGMSLQEQGFRFILRRVDGRIDGYWEHPATVKPGGVDVTDLDDEAMLREVEQLQAEAQ